MADGIPTFAPAGAPVQRFDGEARRTTTALGAELMVRVAADAAAVTLLPDHGANGLRLAKAATTAPVRLLFPADAAALPIEAAGEASGEEIVEWIGLAREGADGALVYGRPLVAPEWDGERFALRLPTTFPAPPGRAFVVVQLGAVAGELRFLVDPLGTVSAGAAAPAEAPAPVPHADAPLPDDLAAMLAEARVLQAELAALERRIAVRAAAAGIAPDTLGLDTPPPPSAGPPRVNWVIGGTDNLGWAYGNGARRLAAELPGFDHAIASTESSDVAVYFDPIVGERFPAAAARSIVRIGGPRPLDRLFGDDRQRLREGLARYDAVVPLNLALHRRTRVVAGRLRLIPNALDLEEWAPVPAAPERPFTVGFAASLGSKTEIEVKGYDIAQRAAERAGLPLLLAARTKDGSSIPPERMRDDFYAACDVLVHPVAPGREGTSNVLMEALACGVPVITTPDAGLHGELLVDGRNALICARDEDAYAEAILRVQSDPELRARLSAEGRAFAERHHDIRVAARRYARLLAELGASGTDAKRRICFVPFWEPAERYASSRLRGLAVVAAINDAGGAVATIGYDPSADIVVVIQMCEDPLMATLAASPQFVVYDVCDRYFENQRLFRRDSGTIDSIARFHELVERADAVIVPTIELKIEVSRRRPDCAVVHLPEPVDYPPVPGAVADPAKRTLLWFGNPDRGNFESAKWLIDALRDRHGYQPRLITRASFFKKYPEYLPFVEEWSMEGMVSGFAEAGLCVVSHAEGEQTKSPNRMIAAVMQGVPTLVHNSASCEALLREAGGEIAIVADDAALDRAVAALADPGARAAHLARVQALFEARHGPAAVAAAYAEAIDALHFAKPPAPTRIAVVSHNLEQGEGAPRSLLELAAGLSRRADVEVVAYSPGEGPLEDLYDAEEVPLTVFDRGHGHSATALRDRFGELRADFHAFLAEERIEMVIANTIKAAPFAYFAHEAGVPAAVIVRESFAARARFGGFSGEALLAAEIGLAEAEEVVFVAAESRAAWADFRFEGRVNLIPNGVDPARFAAPLAMSRAEARAALGLPADGVIALAIGTIGQRKGQVAMVEAFARLPAAVRADATLLFVGTGKPNALAEFAASVAAAGLGGAMVHRPPSEDVGLYYRAADIFLLNSSNEAYPRSIMEAMLFGLPVLSTRVFGVLSQIEEGAEGLLYDIGDMDGWATHFAALVADAGLRERLGAAAARGFWRHVTVGEMLARYRALIGRHAAGGETDSPSMQTTRRTDGIG